MKSKALQLFIDENLKSAKQLSSSDIAKFLDDFRLLHGDTGSVSKSKLISMKVPQNLLDAFKLKASLENIPYQTMIKKLMVESLKK